jgi:hypothetical protein
MIREEENPYRYVEVRGEHVDELSHKYPRPPLREPDPQRARDAANRCLAPIHIPAQLNGVEPRGFPGRTKNQTYPTGGSFLARLLFGMRRAWLAAIILR